MRRSSVTFVTALVAIGLIVGRALPILVARMGERAPIPGWSPAILLALFAGVVAVLAWSMWQNLRRDGRTISSNYGVRMIALAKASILVSAIFAGGYAGFTLAFVGYESAADSSRFWQGAAASLAAAALLAAALVLEWACQLPASDEDDDSTEASPA